MPFMLSDLTEKELRIALSTYRGKLKFDMYLELFKWGIISKSSLIKKLKTIIDFVPDHPSLKKDPE